MESELSAFSRQQREAVAEIRRLMAISGEDPLVCSLLWKNDRNDSISKRVNASPRE
jgi:hypothetical protein